MDLNSVEIACVVGETKSGGVTNLSTASEITHQTCH
jgi:hypothetical protein